MDDPAGQLHEDFRRIRPPLEGELVRLRAIEEDDLPRLNELFNDADVLVHLDVVPFGQPLTGIREFWERTRGRDDLVNFVIETLPGEPIGIVGLEGIDPSARVATLGIWIGQPHWEQGYGTDAMRTVCRLGFACRCPSSTRTPGPAPSTRRSGLSTREPSGGPGSGRGDTSICMSWACWPRS